MIGWLWESLPVSENMSGLLMPLLRETVLSRSCSLRSRAAWATATLPEPAQVENLEVYPRGL